MRGWCSLLSVVEHLGGENIRFGDAYVGSKGEVELYWGTVFGEE